MARKGGNGGKEGKGREGKFVRKYDRKDGEGMSGEQRGKGGKEGKGTESRLWEEI